MAMSGFKERLFLRVPAFHKYLSNICYVEVFGPHPKKIVPALGYGDFLELDGGSRHYIIRTDPEIYGDRRYPLYYVEHNKLYTRTLKEIVERADIKVTITKEKETKDVSDTVRNGAIVGKTEINLSGKDEKLFTPLTVGQLLKRECHDALYRAGAIPLLDQIKLMVVGWAMVEIAKWFIMAVLSRFG